MHPFDKYRNFTVHARFVPLGASGCDTVDLMLHGSMRFFDVVVELKKFIAISETVYLYVNGIFEPDPESFIGDAAKLFGKQQPTLNAEILPVYDLSVHFSVKLPAYN